MQNVKVTTNSSRLNLRKWTHHKFIVRRYDEYYVKLLDWTLYMGNSFKGMSTVYLIVISRYSSLPNSPNIIIQHYIMINHNYIELILRKAKYKLI